MKTVVLILLFFFTVNITTYSQLAWDYAQYENYNHENFRDYPALSQIVDFDNPDIPLLNAALFFLTNEQRSRRWRSIIEYHPNLEIAAYHHSKAMVEQDFYSHVNPEDPRRKTPVERGKLAGINNPFFAENIAYSDVHEDDTYLEIAEIIMNLWMKSSPHKKNILSKDALQLGCGVYFKEKRIFATQNFQFYEEIKTGHASDSLPEQKNTAIKD